VFEVSKKKEPKIETTEKHNDNNDNLLLVIAAIFYAQKHIKFAVASDMKQRMLQSIDEAEKLFHALEIKKWEQFMNEGTKK
jgi:hypothetical protein